MAVKVISVTRLNPTQVLLNTDIELTQDVNYTLTVTNVKDLFERAIEPTLSAVHFIGIGSPPHLDSVTVTNPTTLRLVFNEEMKQDAALLLPANYVVTGVASLVVSLVTWIDIVTVDLTVSEMLTGGSYTLTVSNVRDLLDNVISPLFDSQNFIGVGVAPEVLPAAAAVDSTSVRVTFNEFMRDDAALVDNANYTITGPTVLTKGTVTPQGPGPHDEVVIDVSEMLQGGAYQVDVATVTDLVGNTLNPAAAFANWVGIGIAPQVVSATSLGFFTVQIVFNEDMSPIGLEVNANYEFTTCPIVAPITVFDVNAIDAKTVNITTAGDMVTGVGNYTVHVYNVTDAAGNTIDLAHDHVAFDGMGNEPKVISPAVVLDSVTVRVSFNKNMTNDAAFNALASYTITGDTVLIKSAVTPVGAGPLYNAVDITVSEMLQDADYQVEVVGALTDLITNPLDPLFTIATWHGVGVGPQVVSATAIDHETVDVLFNEDVDAGNSIVIGNYFIETGNLQLVSAVAINNTTIEVVFDTHLDQATAEDIGNYDIQY